MTALSLWGIGLVAVFAVLVAATLFFALSLAYAAGMERGHKIPERRLKHGVLFPQPENFTPAVGHRPGIRQRHTEAGGVMVFQPYCTCGWEGAETYLADEARAQTRVHHG